MFAKSLSLSLMRSELRVMFTRRRTWAMLAAIALIPILLAVAVALTTEQLAPGEGPPFLDRVTQNGLFTGFTATLLALPLFLPLTMAVVAGDTIAGEASLGTLRYLLIAPVGRLRLLVVKYLGTIVFALAGTFTLMLAGGIIGAILFPIGPVTLLSGDQISLAESIGRMALVAIYTAISMSGLLAIGLFVSTLTTVPVGAMAATVVLAGVSQILDNLPQLSWLHEWLFTHYWLSFADLLRQPIELGSLASNSLLQLGYIAVFGALAYSRFTTKDILS
ncbi:ABC transporter permease subunit [Candidatus Aquiluna sp. IMCC13023]|uniref:ABC transporter permease n=1 Tax=Candidatus Aquiluna sp. IMCC13023 TaxID=1081644 RepID=UPI0002EFD018